MVRQINTEDNLKRIEQGEKAHEFLQSEIWNEFIRPMLESFSKGLLDASSIDVSSDKKASIEIKSRVLAAKYVDSIELLLKQYVDDGEISKKIMAPAEEKNPIIRKYD